MQSREYLGSILLSIDLFQYSASYAKIYPTKENLDRYGLSLFPWCEPQKNRVLLSEFQRQGESSEMQIGSYR